MSSYFEQGDPEEAYRYFKEAYDAQMQGNIDEAIRLYSRSIEIFPTAEAHTFLGWAYSFKKCYDLAISECETAIKLDPDYGNPYNDIGAYLIEQDDLDGAVEWLEKALEAKRYDSYCYPHYNLGRVWEKRGDWQRALRSYQNALLSNPEYTLAEKAIGRLQGLMN